MGLRKGLTRYKVALQYFISLRKWTGNCTCVIVLLKGRLLNWVLLQAYVTQMAGQKETRYQDWDSKWNKPFTVCGEATGCSQVPL